MCFLLSSAYRLGERYREGMSALRWEETVISGNNQRDLQGKEP